MGIRSNDCGLRRFIVLHRVPQLARRGPSEGARNCEDAHTPSGYTEYILVETGNWLARVGDRAAFLKLLDDLAVSSTTVVPGSARLFEEGVRLFRERPDKDWGMTDCISFIVMRERGLSDALTADRHFEQAGFRALLREAS